MEVWVVHKKYDYDDRSFIDVVCATKELADAYVAKYSEYLDEEGDYDMWVTAYSVLTEGV